MRIIDSLRVHLLVLAGLLSGLLVCLGSRAAWLGGLLVLAGLVGMAQDYRARAAPSGTGADLTLLWFNVLGSNPTPPQVIARAVRESGADIVVMTEAAPAVALRDTLADLYPYQAGCAVEDKGHCSMLILSRLPLRDLRLEDLSRLSQKRAARFSVETEEGRTIALRALHVVKPWKLAFSHEEETKLHDVLEDRPEGQATVVFGDFNAAPWSRRMRTIERRHGLRHAPWPVATWPVPAGRLGVPIDHVLLGDGAALTSLSQWGAQLGSNHLGLLAEIAFPDQPDPDG